MPKKQRFSVWAFTDSNVYPIIMSVEESFAAQNAKNAAGTIYFFSELSEVDV